ncbi:MAG: hypothetical protein ABSC55_03415 [Syntrophorhabdales bacterium]|jgi:hypothetical protein
MPESSKQGLQTLYEQLLKLVEKEEQAITANHLGELQACVRRKQEIIGKLREIESKKGQDGPSEHSEEVARLLEQVATRHERARERIRTMLIECQKAILEVRTAQQAHRAYYRARKKGRERPARLL